MFRDKDYVVKSLWLDLLTEEEVLIVDDFTGRIMQAGVIQMDFIRQ